MRTYVVLFIVTLCIGIVAGILYKNPKFFSEKFMGVQVLGLSYKPLSDSSVSISFKTNKPVSVKLDYGTTELYGVETSQSALAKEHQIVLSGLLPGKDHNFKVEMKDEKGKTYSSGNYVVKSN